VAKLIFANQERFLRWASTLDPQSEIALNESLRYVATVSDLDALPVGFYKELYAGIGELRIGKTLEQALKVIGRPAAQFTNARALKVLLRVFVSKLPSVNLLILSGYDKQQNIGSAYQKSEIAEAIEMLRNWLLRNDVF